MMFFLGDALFDGGNDAPVKTTGVEYLAVKNPEDTMEHLKLIVGLYGYKANS
jgi:phosphomannomutase